MKLSIVFDETKEESIMYSENEVYICTKSSDRVQALLINEQLKYSNLEFRKMTLDDVDMFDELDTFDDEDISSQKDENMRAIKTIEKALERSFTLVDFTHCDIKFEKFNRLSNYINFLNSIQGDIILDVSSFTKEDIKILKNISFQSEPKIKYKLNLDLVSLSEFVETMEIIETIETTIERFALSEIEQQMLLFDLIRNRIYKNGNPKDPSSSRDLSRVLKEDEIVCAGYANIFTAVSNYLGIPTFVKKYVLIADESRGHATTVSYIHDSIYDLDLVLEFDATWNSRRSEEDDSWINEYGYFGQSEALATKIKEKKGYEVIDSFNKELTDLYNRYLLFEKKAIPFCTNHVIRKFVNKVVQVFRYLNQEEKANTLEVFLSELQEDSQIDSQYIKNLYEEIQKINRGFIRVDDFVKILYRVRRIEHSLDPKKYPLDLNIIEQIISDKYDPDKIFLKMIGAKNQISKLDVLSYIPKNRKDKIKYDTKMMEFLFQLRRLEASKNPEKGLTNK